MINARSTARRKAFKEAEVIHQDLQLFMICTLRNLSEKGALLDFNRSICIPKEFDLRIKAENIVVPCEVVWHEDQTVGVRFNWPSQTESH